jgi:hypothetical protein
MHTTNHDGGKTISAAPASLDRRRLFCRSLPLIALAVVALSGCGGGAGNEKVGTKASAEVGNYYCPDDSLEGPVQTANVTQTSPPTAYWTFGGRDDGNRACICNANCTAASYSQPDPGPSCTVGNVFVISDFYSGGESYTGGSYSWKPENWGGVSDPCTWSLSSTPDIACGQMQGDNSPYAACNFDSTRPDVKFVCCDPAASCTEIWNGGIRSCYLYTAGGRSVTLPQGSDPCQHPLCMAPIPPSGGTDR